ncbi:MAG: 50S ribosomal protein L15 [Candidatus Babeliales bacterium]|jgi:large subunit ribosomal protein L15
MLQLNKLEGLTKKRKRIGRGGDRGGQSGRGHKGQKARTGAGPEIKPCFEGGQMPLSRRIPRRGFNNALRKETQVIDLNTLEAHFVSGDTIDRATLRSKGLVSGKGDFLVKVLNNGTLTKQLTIVVDGVSASAKSAIERAGGKVHLTKEKRSDSPTTEL